MKFMGPRVPRHVVDASPPFTHVKDVRDVRTYPLPLRGEIGDPWDNDVMFALRKAYKRYAVEEKNVAPPESWDGYDVVLSELVNAGIIANGAEEGRQIAVRLVILGLAKQAAMCDNPFRYTPRPRRRKRNSRVSMASDTSDMEEQQEMEEEEEEDDEEEFDTFERDMQEVNELFHPDNVPKPSHIVGSERSMRGGRRIIRYLVVFEGGTEEDGDWFTRAELVEEGHAKIVKAYERRAGIRSGADDDDDEDEEFGEDDGDEPRQKRQRGNTIPTNEELHDAEIAEVFLDGVDGFKCTLRWSDGATTTVDVGDMVQSNLDKRTSILFNFLLRSHLAPKK